MRRAIALIVGGFMLVLNYERANVACAKHQVTQPSHGAMQHHASQERSHAPAGKDCATPAQADCCAAIATCSIVLEFSDVAVSMSAITHEAAVAPIVSAPESRVTTPDPPPPRV